MNKMKMIACSILVFSFSHVCLAQKAGASSRITTGKIASVERIKLDSEAGKGALVGGSLGLVSASGKKSSKKARNTLIGAVAGGALASSAQGSREGTRYTVNAINGSAIKIVTDQTELRVGDCVNVEESDGTANIRRVSSNMCEPTYSQAVQAVEAEMQEEASECIDAKQMLVNASSKEEAELAKMKMDILCSN